MLRKSTNRLPGNQHIQLEIQKTSEGDLSTESEEFTTTPKERKEAEQAGQEALEEPEEDIKHSSKCK